MRKQPQQRRARESVDAIVEATRQLLEERPIDAWTTDAVAERAGVSIGTLYQYFEDKADLVREVGACHIRGMATRMAMLEPPEPGRDALRRHARRLLEITAEAHTRDRRLHDTLQEVGLLPDLRRTLETSERDARKALARVAAGRGVRDPDATAALAYDLIERFAHKRLAELDGPCDEALGRTLDRYAEELASLLSGET
jgi:AcrR family transcriptional regulator